MIDYLIMTIAKVVFMLLVMVSAIIVVISVSRWMHPYDPCDDIGAQSFMQGSEVVSCDSRGLD